MLSSIHMFSTHQRKARLLFAMADVLLIAFAFESAYQTRVWLPAEFEFYLTPPIKALLLGTAIAAWLLVGNWFEVYERLDSAQFRVIIRDTFRQCALGAMSVVLLEYTLRLNLSRSFLGLFGINSWILLCLFRWKARTIVGVIRREFGVPRYVMIVGVGKIARRIGNLIESSSAYGVYISGFVLEHPSTTVPDDQLFAHHPVYSIERLPNLVKAQVIDDLIVAVDSKCLPSLEEVFLFCDEEGIRTHIAVDVFPHVNSSVYLQNIGAAPLLTFSAAPHDEVRLFLKRVMDVVLACTALVLLFPFMVIAAVLIKLTSPGPLIFRQVRCGLNGRRFICYKFRSMCVGAEGMKPALAHLTERETAFKIFKDPRLTSVGRYLRKFSIDEWPQLWNVVKGDMSLVGPRPAVPEEVHSYKRWQRRRLRMRPGLTCLWAINGRDELDFETWMKLDMEYIDRWSLGLDWKIIVRTIPHVLLGTGAH